MSRTRQAYNRWAATYDCEPNPQTRLEEPHVLALVAARPGERILDAACGTGRYCRHFCKTGAHAVGVDFSEAMLERARMALPHVSVLRADLETRLPFGDGVFDKVNCAQALKHIADIQHVLREFSRVIRTGGTVTFSVTHPDMRWEGYELSCKPSFILSAESEIHPYAFRDYETAIRRAGLNLQSFVAVPVDETIQELLTPASFAETKGRPQVAIFHCSRP